MALFMNLNSKCSRRDLLAGAGLQHFNLVGLDWGGVNVLT
jgi:hypothetical protein